jgi:hypothetical protein
MQAALQQQQQQQPGTFAGQVAIAIQPKASEQRQSVPEKPKADDHGQQGPETNDRTKDTPERSAGETAQAAESSEHEDKPAATPTGLTPDKDNIPTAVRKRPAAKSLIRRRTTGGLTTPPPVEVKPKGAINKRKGPTTKTVPRKAAKPTKNAVAKAAASAISSGSPDEKLEGGWPNGWIKKVFRRQNGATKGGTDSYWYTPEQGYKLRSMKEVKRFMKALTMTNGDEARAKKIFKTVDV